MVARDLPREAPNSLAISCLFCAPKRGNAWQRKACRGMWQVFAWQEDGLEKEIPVKVRQNRGKKAEIQLLTEEL